MPELAFSRCPTNGIELNVGFAGPEDGPPVVLLHGFPEFWYGWRHQLEPLAKAGYRLIVPDQRGYNQSEKPAGVDKYRLDILADDVAGLLRSVTDRPAAFVGHDWGGIVAWRTALQHPSLVGRLAVLNAPHPLAFQQGFLRHPSQLLKSWYVFFFQLPRLAELRLSQHNFAPLVEGLRRTSRPGTFSDDVVARYRDAWIQPRALTAMIHWYRAALRQPPPRLTDVRVHQPTLLIWGVRDRFIHPGFAHDSIALCDRGRLERIENATHWVQHEEPDRVNRLLLDFLAEADA